MGVKERIFQFFGKDKDDTVKKSVNIQVNDESDDDDDYFTDTRMERIKKFLFHDVRARVVYSLIIGILLGIGIPLLVYFLRDHSETESNLGSCMINTQYRFECLINKPLPISAEDCYNANCCWENNNDLPFKCYHSLPSAYNYKAASISEGFPKQVKLTPKGNIKMDNLNIDIECESTHHLSITLNKKSSQRKKEKILNCENLASNLTLSNDEKYFYFTIQRETTKNFLIDTRMGPLSLINNEISFSTLIPSTKFYGFRGFEKLESMITHYIVNRHGSQDMPYYISLEGSGHVHAVLIETDSPFIVQGIEAPGLMFHFENYPNPPEVKISVFDGPTVRDLYNQIYEYLNIGNPTPIDLSIMPPYWGLGLHLCRYTNDEAQLNEKIKRHFREDNSNGPIIPYDSDCIDENLRVPFIFDDTKFKNLTHIISYLEGKEKKLLLTQKSSMPQTIAEEEGVEWMSQLTIKYQNGSVFIGESNGIKRIYPDFVNSNIDPWVRQKLYRNTPVVEFNGLVLNDNWPLNEDTVICTSGTRIRESFLLRNSNEGSDKNRPVFGAICPVDSVHNASGFGEMSHLAIHNNLGGKTLQAIHNAVWEEKAETGNKDRIFLVGASVSKNSYGIGGFSGIEVPFTWVGLKESLEHIVRNFMFLPFTGTPICGSWNPQEEGSSILESNLCFRWFQLGLLLPFARNTYGNDTVSSTRGPTDLVLTDQNHLVSLIKERYAINPYYYTLYYELLNGNEAKNPPIAPLSYHFSTPVTTNNFLFDIHDQFMIGPALMATPNIQKGNQFQRNAMFPLGKWFDITGMLVADVKEVSQMSKFVQIAPNHLPIFIRGGYIIPTLTTKDEVSSAEDSRKGNYTILVTLPEANESNSTGTLFLDDGISINSVAGEEYDLIQFECSNTELRIIPQKCGFNPPPEISKIIHEVKIFSFPKVPSNVTINNEDEISFTFNDDNNVLRLRNITIDPCADVNFTTIINWRT